MQKIGQSLTNLARQNGIDIRRPSSDGTTAKVSAANLRKMLAALNVDTAGVEEEDTSPASCYIPMDMAPTWGVSLQLYELRSDRNWGIGDFADLWKFCEIAGSLGADFIGLSPLHAGFLSDPDRCSPYEPSNRRFLNPLYIAVDEIGGFEGSEDLEQQLAGVRNSPLVDYKAVSEVKLDALRRLWQGQRGHESFAFGEFVEKGGNDLHLHALFESISHVMAERGAGSGWKTWPAEYQLADSPAVSALEQELSEEIRFHKWLQWLAHVQLAEACERARQAGMRIGLYLDLAVGEALDGSATWSEPDIYVSGAGVGNPPEPFATDGQDWRLAALLPASIAEGEPSPFQKLLAASMQYAGAIRIDHAAAIARLFLVPLDGTPADGAYVSHPTEDLLRVLTQTSVEHQCIVIGEDLGNVANGLREELAEAQVLSYRILSYEQTGKGFIAPENYPTLALACVSTHDHQTFNGWWRGADIDMRLEHGLVPADTTERHREERQREQEQLIAAFSEAAVLPQLDDERLEPALALAAYRFIAQTPSVLVAVRLADLTDEKLPTNIPGTSGSYPNWRPKLSVSIEEILAQPFVTEISAMMRDLRPRKGMQVLKA